MIDTEKDIGTKRRKKGDKTKVTARDITFVKKIMSNGNEKRDLKGSKKKRKEPYRDIKSLCVFKGERERI